MNHVKKSGFTLIELMLAMTFISMLLMAIALTTIQISNIYNKGLTLREVNQAGRALSDELQRSIASSTPFNVDQSSPTTKYITRPGGGRLCVGAYTYAWNLGSALNGGNGAPSIYNKYQDGTPIRFAKVSDPSGALCATPTLNIVKTSATELLTSGDRDLVIHAFTVARGANDPTTEQSLYTISMTIGTNDQRQLTADDASCKPPSEGVGDEDYCSVNQFDIIARAGNKSGGSK